MATLIVDIPDEDFKKVNNTFMVTGNVDDRAFLWELIKVIKDGTPLNACDDCIKRDDVRNLLRSREYIDKQGFLDKLRYMGYMDDKDEEEEIERVADLFTVKLPSIYPKRNTEEPHLDEWAEHCHMIADKPINECEAEDCISREETLKAMDSWDKFGLMQHGYLFKLRNDNMKDYVPYVHYEDMIKCVSNMPSVYPKSDMPSVCLKSDNKDYILREDAFMSLTGDITDCSIEEFIKRLRDKLSKLSTVYPKSDKLEKITKLMEYWNDMNSFDTCLGIKEILDEN